MRSTCTVISWPGVATCDVSDTRDQPISDTWSRPCTPPPKIDERAEVAHGHHAARDHRADRDRLPDLHGACLLFLFEQRPARHDELLAALAVFDDLERVDAAVVRRLVGLPR